MIMPANVIIRKQKFRIRTPDEQTALRLRKELNEGLQYDYISMLERIFQQHAPADLYLHLGNLSVNLGTISQQEFETHFLEVLETKLLMAVTEKIQEQMAVVYTGKSGATSRDSGQKKDSPDISHPFSEKEQQWLALIYFLEKGIYPWWFRSRPKTPKELFSSLEETDLERLALKLIEINKGNKERGNNVIQRAVTHLPADKKDALIRKLLVLKNDSELSVNAKSVLRHRQVLEKIFRLTPAEFYIYFIKSMIDSSAADRVFIKIFISKLMYKKDISAIELQKFMANKKEFPAKEILQPLADITGEYKDAGKKHADIYEQTGQKQSSETPEKTPRTKTVETTSQAEEGIYISNAGLILVHPFLEGLFTECKLLDEKKQFISEAKAIHAAVLLWYLQTGEDEMKEWETAFCKILSGLEVETAVPDDNVLSAGEKQECDELLKMVLEYWSALRTEDINLLRGSFINREGKISWKDDYWLLQVERTGIDILLDKLPWGYGTVKLPWLHYLIHVEW